MVSRGGHATKVQWRLDMHMLLKSSMIGLLALGTVTMGSSAQQPVAPQPYGGTVTIVLHVANAEPVAGTLKYGRLVALNDGSCPQGWIRVIGGGDNGRRIPRLDAGCQQVNK